MTHELIIEISGRHQGSVRGATNDPRLLSALRELLEDQFPALLQECFNDLAAHACGEEDWQAYAEFEEKGG